MSCSDKRNSMDGGGWFENCDSKTKDLKARVFELITKLDEMEKKNIECENKKTHCPPSKQLPPPQSKQMPTIPDKHTPLQQPQKSQQQSESSPPLPPRKQTPTLHDNISNNVILPPLPPRRLTPILRNKISDNSNQISHPSDGKIGDDKNVNPKIQDNLHALPHDDMLNDIKSGIQLKPVSERILSPKPQEKQKGIHDVLLSAMSKRRGKVSDDNEPDDANGKNDEWTVGGSANYKMKYLKYKMKYIKLKNNSNF